MPILYSQTGQKVWAEPGTYNYNDYIRAGFTTTPPAGSENTNYATSPIEQNQPASTSQPSAGTPSAQPVYTAETLPSNYSGNYIRSDVITPALQVDALYQKYFGRVGEQPERNYWITKPASELEKQLQLDYETASGHAYDGTPILKGNQQSQRDLNPQQYQNTPNPTQETGTTGNQPGAGDLPSTGNAEVDAMLKIAKDILDALTAKGIAINPNIEITPEKVAEFMAKAGSDSSLFELYAQQEIDPYYINQFKLARENLLQNIDYQKNALLNTENEYQKQYGTDLRTLGESAAERGFAQSGIRQRDERDLAQNYQNVIDTNRRQLEFNLGNSARTFAQEYGSSELPIPTINQAPIFQPGIRDIITSNQQTPFYNLSDEVYNNLIGSQEFQRRKDIKSRASELESAFRTDAALNQEQQLL